MKTCPFIFREVVTRETKVDEEGRVLEEKETPSIEERECLKVECELYNEEAGRCVLPLLSQITSFKLEERLEGIAGGQKEEKDILSELGGRFDELRESLKKVGESSEKALKAVLAEAEKGRSATEEGLSGVKESLSAISDTVSQISENGSKGVQLLDEVSDRLLKQIPASIESSGEKMVDGLSQASGKLGELLDLNRESSGRILGSIEELSRAVSQISGLLSDRILGSIEELSRAVSQISGFLEGQAELVKGIDKRLSQAVAAMEGFVSLEKETGDRVEVVVGGIRDSISKIGEFLEAQRERREEEKEGERMRRAREHNDRGVSLYYRGVFEAAATEFERAIELNPDEATSYNNLGLCLTKLDRSEEAVASFRKAIEASPEFAEAYNNLGLVYYEKTDYEEAVDLFNQALQKHENYALAYANLGNALHQQEKYEEATRSWERALEIDPACEEAKKAIELFKEGRVDGGHHQKDQEDGEGGDVSSGQPPRKGGGTGSRRAGG